MDKYWQIFKISFQQELAYRANFIMWRVRNILQIFVAFYLWDTIFSDPGRTLFGYNRAKILTYVFGLILVRAFVLSAKAADVAGEIARGDLNNYLLKPINYFRYWLTRDISSKALNLSFAITEAVILYFLLKPPFFIQTNPLILLGFSLSLLLAMLVYFVIVFIVDSVPFWMPEGGWGMHFLITVIAVEFLSGALFPLDILPIAIQRFLNFTPFPYLIFFPIQIYLGKIEGVVMLKGLVITGIWLVGLYFVMKSIWSRGLKAYQAHGK